MFRILYFCLKTICVIAILTAISVVAIIYYYSKDLPDYSQLANYHPPSVTRIYSADGKLIEEYALEHRIFIPINNIPHSLIEAFVAAEDKNFFSHSGLDIYSIFRAVITNLFNIIQHKRMEGASTITQQVVKNFLLTSERSIERKIKEAILSYMTSQVFSKREILELYLNQIFLGRGAYGVAIAAQNYFDKSVDELNLAESAFIAGLPKGPSNYDPEKNYKRAKERRDYVLARMLEEGYIDENTTRETINSPIVTRKRNRLEETISAQYYAEAVREEIIKLVGKEEFYTGGLTIITSLNSKIQDDARNALRKGIRDFDTKKGYRGPIANIKIDNWQNHLKNMSIPSSMLEYKLAIILDVTDTQAKIGLTDGNISKIALTDTKWAKAELKSAKVIFKKGDIIAVEPTKTGHGLRQIPQVNGGIIVMNPQTGQVLAAQGGYDFDNSKFDRVTQASRQPGSLSKTFVYLAGLENNMQPNRIFTDAPIEISQGAGMPTWKPKNYKNDFLGHITMRTGLEKSRNLVTVRVAQNIGLNKVAETIKRFGINQEPKKVYSMVLGSIETTLEKMTTAYGMIANSGKKIVPHYVELVKNRHGKVIYRRSNASCQNCLVDSTHIDNYTLPIKIEERQRMVTDEASAYQITSMLEGVVQRGTATAAKKLGKTMAGKTGTSNDSKDVWFIGFTPKIVVGTYVGYDIPKDMGTRATGASVALPIFVDFMEHAYIKEPSLDFIIPETIKIVAVDAKTGGVTTGAGILEAFKINNLPFSKDKNLQKDDHEIELMKNQDDQDIFKNLNNEELFESKDTSEEVY
ncbi:MAG: penicillin-binding protein 1A [Rickettsiaceae bacterium]|nr:MAG: penicillin-binding protein 1A [Rickettsiaceae bacterium]